MRPLLPSLVPLAVLGACASTAPSERTITAADSLPVSYEIRGAGSPALVFLHGWCCDRTFWDGQLDAFARDHVVVAVDLGGHGKSGTARASWTMDQLAGDAAAVIRHEGLADVIVVGHSMGGPVGLMVAAALPDRIVGVIGVDTLQNADFEFSAEARQRSIRALEEDFPGRCRAMSRGMVGPAASAALTERIVASMSAGPADVGVGLMRDFLDYDPRQGLRRAGVPILCINAASERYPTDVAANRRYASGFELIEMDGVGHFLMMEKPAEFNALLAQAIERVASRRRDR